MIRKTLDYVNKEGYLRTKILINEILIKVLGTKAKRTLLSINTGTYTEPPKTTTTNIENLNRDEIFAYADYKPSEPALLWFERSIKNEKHLEEHDVLKQLVNHDWKA